MGEDTLLVLMRWLQYLFNKDDVWTIVNILREMRNKCIGDDNKICIKNIITKIGIEQIKLCV